MDILFKNFGEYLLAIKKASDSWGKDVDPRLKERGKRMIVKYKYELDIEVDFVMTDTTESANDIRKLIENVLSGVYFYEDQSAFIKKVNAKHIEPLGIINADK